MAILFDLDGTLLDTALDFLYIINRLRTEENLPILNLQDIRSQASHGVINMICSAFQLSATDSKTEPLSKRFLELYQKNYCIYTKPFPGILDLLTALEQKSIPWGIVTNKPKAFTLPILTTLNLKDRAACIISGDSTAKPKPFPEPILAACEILKVRPQQCIYIGDAKRDIEAGKAANTTTIAALYGYIAETDNPADWGADHLISKVTEILPQVLKCLAPSN